MALNMAMFEQNGQSGYVLKPAVMWYNHFNPWDKEFDGLHATKLTLHVSFIKAVYVKDFSFGLQKNFKVKRSKLFSIL